MVTPLSFESYLHARRQRNVRSGQGERIEEAAPIERNFTLSIRLVDDCLLMSLHQDDQMVCVGILESFSRQLVRFQELDHTGRALFELLLPKRIQTFFLSTPSAALTLCVDPQVSEIPWESASVHEIQLCDLHKVSRTLLLPLTGLTIHPPYGRIERALNGDGAHLRGTERALRQLTVLSYDLVGSTQMMREMGVEKYSMLLDKTHLKFASVIQKWEGQSDPPLGDDGIMCYFGLHLARPGAPQKALNAALDLIQEAQSLGVRIRVGVATGMVAVDASHKIGPSIHLAARLQCLTEPGTVSACEETRQLTQHLFSWGEAYTLAHLNGFEQAIRFSQVLQRNGPHNADTWTGLSRWPLVGRKQELEWLRLQWRQATQYRGRMVQIEGEAGIGKSKLVSAFAKERHADQTRVLVCRCSPDTMSRPFAPFIRLLERYFQIETLIQAEAREQHLNQTFANWGVTESGQHLSRLLLGLNDAASPAHGVLTRKELLGQMVKWVLAQPEKRPVLLLVKDVQWADPSTLAFLNKLAQSLNLVNLLVVVTRRIEGLAPSQPALPFQEVLRIHPLSEQEARQLVQCVRGHQDLKPDAVQLVLDKAQGIPLFVEELTRYLLSQPTGDLNTLTLPATVQEVLLQRLDLLGPNKRIAQLCSVLGREISWPLLLQLWRSLRLNTDDFDHSPELSLRAGLQALQDNGLLAKKKSRGDPVYYFRHAMIEDAAYHSMWQLDRRQLHRMVAKLLENSFPRICHEHPALLAHHWALAESYENAIGWSMKASKKCEAAQSNQEALAQLQAARQWLEHLPDAVPKQQQLLEIELQTANQVVAINGYGNTKVAHAYQQALSLALQVQDHKALLRIQLGLEEYHLVRGDYGQAHFYLAQALETARQFNDSQTRANCEWALGCILLHQGDVVQALEKIDASLEHCERHGAGYDIAHSPEVMARMYSGVCSWLLGDADQALERTLRAVYLAERIGNRVSLGQALGVLAMVHWGRGELEQVLTSSVRALAVFEVKDHTMWSAQARFMRGFAMAELANPSAMQAGLAQMEKAQGDWIKTGAKLSLTFFQTLKAQMLGRFGRFQEALSLIDQTLALINRHGEAYFEAEVWRIKGELLLRAQAAEYESGCTAQSSAFELAHTCFSKGLQVARQRQMRALELRCLCSVAQHPINIQQHASAISSLRQCLGQFTEGQETRDLIQARQILQMQNQP